MASRAAVSYPPSLFAVPREAAFPRTAKLAALLVDDDPDGVAEYAQIAEEMDLACYVVKSAQEAIRLLDIKPEIGIVLANIHMPGMDGLAFLETLKSRPQAQSALQTVAISGQGSMNLAVSAMRLGAVDFLSKPISRADYEGALQRAVQQHEQASASQNVRPAEATRLSQLSDEVARIAKALSNIAQAGDYTPPAPVEVAIAPRPSVVAVPKDGTSLSAATVRSIIRGREARFQFFERALFADPAWDILLDLTAARLECKRVSVSSLCIAAGVPSTTALRWIKEMTAAGLLVRRSDPTDGRRIFIDLSDEAFAKMDGFLRLYSSKIALC